MATVLNVTEILKRSDGTEVKISGDSKFYAQNNYANLILLDIEDGGSLEACALINFTQQTRQSFTSHNFFMKPVGIVTRVVNDEVINAYQYAIQVPKLVLQNNTKGVIETDLTVTVSFGANYKGYFPNLTNLNVSLPPTEQLQNDLSIAYVVELEQFLQVQYNPTTSVYEWVEVDYVDMFLTQKQYSLSSIYIQPGYSSPQGIAPVSVSNTQVIMNILNDLEVLYNSLEEGLSSHITDLNNPHGVTAEQVDTYVKTTIDLKDADTLEEAKDFTYSRTVIDNKDANTLQEAKDYTYSKVEIDNKDTAIMNKANNLENANMFKDVNYNNVNGILTFTKYDDITKEIDLPLELLVESGYYDEVTNELVLVLANGSEIRMPVGNLLTDLDAHNIRFNGSGTNYLTAKTEVESAVKELDTRVKTNTDRIDGKQDKLVAGTNITIDENTNVISASGGGGGEIDPNEMPYFNYAGSVYGDKYSLLANAWEHSLTVDPSEISENSSFSNPRGTAQYPNGETEGVIIPQGVTTIGNYAFRYWQSNNQPLVIPNSVTEIGFFAFSGWTSNNQPLIIPNSVTNIGGNAFGGWTLNNQPLTIPNSVASIGSYVFYDWPEVPYVEIQAITPPSLASSDAFDGQNNAPIYVPDDSVEAYKTATNWVNLASRIFPISDMSGVNSVNGKTGTVELDAEDIGALPDDTPLFGGDYDDLSNKPTIDQLLGNLTTLGFVKRTGTNNYVIDTSNYQPLDADLSSIAGLSGTSGLLRKTASNTWQLDTSVYLTAITKAQVEAVLTGTITTHTHNASAIVEDASHRFVADTEKNTWNAKQNALGFTPENVANKKTTLSDSDVDYPTSKAVKTAIETAVSQTLKPMGNWNANTNTPTLTDSNINKANEMYYVSVAGTQFGIRFDVGDELVYNTNGVIFRRDNVDSVVSVNTKQGVVVLNQDDIGDGATYKQVSQAEKNTWNNKVDKVTGKGLSTNDYTTTEKSKLAGIASGAEVNVQSNWNATSGDALILNKPIIPTNVSQLNNDSGYITGYTETDPIFTAWNKSTGISITKSQVSDLLEATQALSGLMSATDKQRLDVLHALLEEDTSNSVVDSINEVLAIFNNYPEGADLVTALAGKVDKIEGKGLSTNDLTNALKSNYDTAYGWGNHAIVGYLTAITKAMVEGVLTGTITSHNHSGVYEPANANIQSHISSTSNPHAVTKSQVGLGNVENKSSADIRSELSSSNITTALGYTPYNATNPNNYITSAQAPVQSVSGKTGAVTLIKGDVGLGNVDNIADVNKYVQGVRETRANTNTKIWTGTQAQYDAVGTKDANTLYFII